MEKNNDTIDNKANELELNLNNKVQLYNKRVNELISNNTKKDVNSSKPFKFNFNIKSNIIIGISFFAILITVFYILKLIKPEFICNKILNEKTHFYEYNISIFSHILFTICISIGISLLIYFCYFIYITQFKKT